MVSVHSSETLTKTEGILTNGNLSDLKSGESTLCLTVLLSAKSPGVDAGRLDSAVSRWPGLNATRRAESAERWARQCLLARAVLLRPSQS